MALLQVGVKIAYMCAFVYLSTKAVEGIFIWGMRSTERKMEARKLKETQEAHKE